MNPFLSRMVLNTLQKENNKKSFSDKPVSRYRMAKAYRHYVINAKRSVKDFLFVTAGIFSASFGLKGFLLVNNFIDGGATGISLLISAVTKWPLFIFIILVNIPFLLMASKVVNRTFAIKTALAITGLSACVALVEFPHVTNDYLLVAVFGGFFLGAGIGLAVRGGAVIDGTEVLAIFLSKKLGATMGDIIMVINVFIFSTAAYLLSIETALYSMITYLAASKTLDFVVDGIDEYIGVTIVSPHYHQLKEMIVNQLGRGITTYHGVRGVGRDGHKHETNIIFTVITRLELSRLHTEVEKIDPNAFVVMNSIKDIRGGVGKKRGISH